jgi:putative transposase
MDIEARVRQGVKAVLEEVLQEEMTEHLRAGYRDLTSTRSGYARWCSTNCPKG